MSTQLEKLIATGNTLCQHTALFAQYSKEDGLPVPEAEQAVKEWRVLVDQHSVKGSGQ